MEERGHAARFISPTPLLMVVALGDVLTVSELALAALSGHFRQSSWSPLEGGHFDAYEREFGTASQAAAKWFRQHLVP